MIHWGFTGNIENLSVSLCLLIFQDTQVYISNYAIPVIDNIEKALLIDCHHVRRFGTDEVSATMKSHPQFKKCENIFFFQIPPTQLASSLKRVLISLVCIHRSDKCDERKKILCRLLVIQQWMTNLT